MMQRHAFVTGAAGYIGGHLVRELGEAGWMVTGLVRGPGHADAIGSIGPHMAYGDLGDPSLQVRDISRDTVVFHLAVPRTTWADGVDEGCLAAEGLIRLMTQSGAKRLIHVSSAAVHQPSHGVTVVDESLPLGEHPPWHHYVHQKLAVEEIVMRAHDEGFVSATVVRPTRVIGAGDRRLASWATRLSAGVAEGLGDEQNRRCPIVVARELARGLVACAESTVTVGRAYYLSSAIEITKRDLVSALVAAGMPLPPRPLAKSLVVMAGRSTLTTIEAGTQAVWPKSRGPRAAVIAALERRAGMPVGHDCVVSSRRAMEDFGWRGTEDPQLAIKQAVEWLSGPGARQDAAGRVVLRT